jgi:uncharacterized protein (DUF58 family)
MLGFMAISGMFGLHNLQKLGISIKFPDEIYCDIPAQLTIRLTSLRSTLPHYLLTLHVAGSEAAFPILKPKVGKEQKALVTFTARGTGTVTKAAVTSPFPVNFFVRSNLFSLNAEYLVFPQPKPLPTGWNSGEPKETGNISRLQKGSSGETESIDYYTEKEPLRQIHWKLSARHEELLVKEMSQETGKPVIIDPDQLPGTVEERLGHAAFLINSLMLEGRAVGLKIGGKNILPGISRGHRLKMLGELACHAPD